MTKPWELTDDEIDMQVNWLARTFDEVNQWYRAIATAAVKKYQDWLAAKCVHCPCEGCDLWDYCWPRKHGGDALRDPRQDSCGPYSRYLGQQQGYAKAMLERGRHE